MKAIFRHMSRVRLHAGSTALAVLMLTPAPAALAYSSGVITKAFPDVGSGCNSTQCHNGGTAPVVALTSESGLTVAPGATVTLAMRVEATTSQKYAGLNVSSPTGTLSTGIDPNVQIKQNNTSGKGEVTHKAKTPATVTFRFQWTAPADFTSAVLTGWGNAVNGNGGTSGDKAESSVLTLTACTDGDGDGTYPTTCAGGTDCDDSKSNVSPNATEVCDEVDNDCDGQTNEGVGNTYYTDADHDSYGTGSGTVSCNIPPDTATQAGDCDDNNADANPGETETADQCGDSVDQDCNGSDLSCNTTDQDGDGQSGADGDCDDSNGNIYLGATEVPYDGIDQDCSGKDLTDVDGDGFDAVEADGADCNDNATGIYPGAPETADEADNDCDGATDEGTAVFDDDGDGTSENAGDCDDANNAIHPGATEICGDSIDQDCDGADEPCATPTPTEPPGEDTPTPTTDDSTGCSCATEPMSGSSLGGLGLLASAFALVLRRRRS